MTGELRLHLLGDLEAIVDGETAAFPPSKKTRALLGYLVLTGRSHRRDRLCDLLWDVADDPRGALRWSLSKLRGVVDGPQESRIEADRKNVRFEPHGAWVDALVLRRALHAGTEEIGTSELFDLAALFRGELLEGLELPDHHDFQAWLVAEREQMRRLRLSVLSTLVERLRDDPTAAIPHARALVQADPLDERARAALVRLLGTAGRLREAEQHVDSGRRLMKELGSRGTGELMEAWREVRTALPEGAPAPSEPPAGPDQDVPAAAPPADVIGRDEEWHRLCAALEGATVGRSARVVVLSGEAGVGKTRLLEELRSRAERSGAVVLEGRAFEAESGRPYGPFIDALRTLGPTALGSDLAPLLPELGASTGQGGSREHLFESVVTLLAERSEAAGVMLAIDDVQWLDEASAELLHYVARRGRSLPLLVVLATREGELADNAAAMRVLRGIRREAPVEEIALGPLDAEATAELIRQVRPDLDAQKVYETSGGNPLYALEIARSPGSEPVPATIGELVRDRLDRLPSEAADVLRWAAVLGQHFGVERLVALTSLDDTELVDALTTLERHALIHAGVSGTSTVGYRFSHDVVRRAVYHELSDPRRRLMHRTVARALETLPDPDDTVASEVAHHAALGGDFAVGAAACVRAGRRCIRVFAHSDARALVRRGLRMAESLPAQERVERSIELVEVRLRAGRPDDPERAARGVAELAERALDLGATDHARLGFHMLSHLRWEEGDWSGAQKYTLEAERISRGADERQRAVALAEAGRCLAMLERELGQAEALVLEAGALARRVGIEPCAVPTASGMLRLHRGELDEALALFERGRTLARREGDRELEFQALEQLVSTCIQRGDTDRARAVSEELRALGEKLPEGSERPFAQALHALVRYSDGEADALGALEDSLEELRVVDAKHRLAFALTRAAVIELDRGEAERAMERATEALELATVLDRPSDIAWARVLLVRAAAELGDDDTREAHWPHLQDDALRSVAADVRAAARELAGPTARRKEA